MKRQAYQIWGVGALIAAVVLTVTGCGDSEHHHDGRMDMTPAAPHHDDRMELEDSHTHSDSAHSHADAGHMQHMSEVRMWLKEKLADQYDEPVPPATEAALAQGSEIYRNVCSSCHGLTGKGDGPASAGFAQKPADFTDVAHATYYSDQARLYLIRNGVPGTPMTAWKSLLSEEEIQAVYAYVRSLRSTDESAATSASAAHTEALYACPMHPNITSAQPGNCSICGMRLVLQDEDDHGSHLH